MASKRFYIHVLTIILTGFARIASGQVKIDGPECVIPGTEYQYNFYGKWESDAEITVCVEGGIIPSEKASCYKGKSFNSVRVIWNDNIKKGTLSITAKAGNGTLSITLTSELKGGSIETASRLQSFLYSEKSPAIRCSVATGGSCSPEYIYQWEQSDDNLSWTELKGASAQHLVYEKDPDHTTFLRRKTTEKKSGQIVYSDISILAVKKYSETN